MSAYRRTYADRAKQHVNPAAKSLLETIERKQSNLCVSVDVTSSNDFLSIIDTVGPYVSLIKTHVDIIEDFEPSLMHKIATWSHITNAHPVPGPSIIRGLAAVGLPLGRGLLLLAEMSTAGALARGAYTEDAVRMARGARDFVIGFIAQRRMEGVGLDDAEDFLVLSPGVGLDVTGDGMGQQYRTPEQVVSESGIGIYGKPGNCRQKGYRKAGWDAYLRRL
ncbi:orotidine monophosphate decarboxylase [Lactarius deliciosus]|nr:orotidine monophosphate decarboxylase [Lactarius deliciosus]